MIYSVAKPFKDTGGLRLLRGNLAPEGGAILKVAGVEGGMQDGVFSGRARVFNGERSLIEALDRRPESFEDNDMVVIRYEGPRGAPGMPELLDPTSRITALCRQRHITIALMTDAAILRRIGGPGHRPRRTRGHSSGDRSRWSRTATPSWSTSTTESIDCVQLEDPTVFERRNATWQAQADRNGGVHPDAVPVTDRVLARMRATALPALRGGGMATPSPS